MRRQQLLNFELVLRGKRKRAIPNIKITSRELISGAGEQRPDRLEGGSEKGGETLRRRERDATREGLAGFTKLAGQSALYSERLRPERS